MAKTNKKPEVAEYVKPSQFYAGRKFTVGEVVNPAKDGLVAHPMFGVLPVLTVTSVLEDGRIEAGTIECNEPGCTETRVVHMGDWFQTRKCAQHQKRHQRKAQRKLVDPAVKAANEAKRKAEKAERDAKKAEEKAKAQAEREAKKAKALEEKARLMKEEAEKKARSVAEKAEKLAAAAAQ